MEYQRRKGPIDYKGYGKKRRPGRNTRLTKTGVLVIFVIGLLIFWLSGDEEKGKEERSDVSPLAVGERQNIYDRSLEPLAVSFDLYAAYVKPLEVEDSFKTGETLAAILNLDRDELVKRLRAERSFIWLDQQVSKDVVAELSRQNIAGLYFQKSPVRFYPQRKMAAQVLGYVKDEQGLSGIELYYDKILQGRGLAALGPDSEQAIREGKHVVLTLDMKIQTILEKQMALLLDKTQASSVAAMAVDPANGEIMASVQLPSYDPNTFWDATADNQQMEMVSRTMNPGGLSSLYRYGAAVHADRVIPMQRVEEAPSARVLRPRMQKSGGRARAGYWWPWPGGGFISNELAELPDPTITEEELLAFQIDLGISCADQVDVPADTEAILAGGDCGEGRLNGVSLLGSFSRLVNGGQPVALHFLKGTVDSAGNFAAYQFKGQGQAVQRVSAVLSQSFAASAGDDARFFAAEYLHPLAREDDFVVEGQEGDQSREIMTEEQGYDGVLVAASPVNRPRLVLLVTVRDGEFDLKAASPMRRFGDAFLRLATRELASRKSADQPSYVLPSDKELLASWLEENRRDKAGQVQVKERQDLMPDVRGMSLRKALLKLMACQVAIEIEGAGQVMEQEPAPGQSCGERVKLRLAAGGDEVERP